MGTLISTLAGTVHRMRERERTLMARALQDSQAHFRMIIEGVQDYAIFMLDPDGRVASWNRGAERIKGWSESEILGQHFSVFLPNDARPGRHLEIAAATGTFREEAERVRKDGSRFWADATTWALHDSNGALRGYAKVVRDISERVRTTRDMAESRSRLASVVELAMDAIITVDLDQRIVLFNAAAEAMFGCPATEVMGAPLERVIPQRFRAAHAKHIVVFAATGVTSRAMGRLGTLSGLRSNGDEFPMEASISQATVDGNKLFTVILRDITERKRAEEHQSLLLRELAHRVKNTLAVVQAIAAQTRRFAASDQFQDKFNGRLAALGTAHDLLTSSEWEGATLGDVVHLCFAPYADLSTVPRWTIDGPAIWLAPNEAVTLTLAFHELATNAAKYGALSNGNGKVAVRWSVKPEDEPAALMIHWLEQGGPAVTPPLVPRFRLAAA